MIKAKNMQYYVDERLVRKVWKEKDKFYAKDKCCEKYEIEEQDYIKLGEE